MIMENALPPTLHKLSAVSARTGLSRSALYREIKVGRLKTVKIGRARRVRENDLNDFIDSIAVA
jgi:excisionase family DNA binding protein